MGKVRKEFLWLDTGAAEKACTAAYLRDELTGLCYALPVGYFTIGRMDDIDVDIPIRTTDEYMSRQQGDITLIRNFIGEFAMYFTDKVDKPNPSHINGVTVYHSNVYQLYDGDVLRMGRTPLTVHLWPAGKDGFNDNDTVKEQ